MVSQLYFTWNTVIIVHICANNESQHNDHMVFYYSDHLIFGISRQE